jgi:hypothetical protein
MVLVAVLPPMWLRLAVVAERFLGGTGGGSRALRVLGRTRGGGTGEEGAGGVCDVPGRKEREEPVGIAPDEPPRFFSLLELFLSEFLPSVLLSTASRERE